MKKGEYIIWDSNFGYEVGFFEKEEGVVYDTHQVRLITGVAECLRPFPASCDKVKPFTKETIEELNKKYTYPATYEYEYLLEALNNKKSLFLEKTK